MNIEKLSSSITEFVRDESGQGTAELGRAVKIAVIAAIAIVAASFAYQFGFMSSAPDAMFHKLRSVASSHASVY